MSDDNILEALDALREADQDMEASAVVEARVVEAYRRRARQRRWMRAYAGAVAVAAVLLVAVVLRPQHSQPRMETTPILVAPAAIPLAIPEVPSAHAERVQIRRAAASVVQPREVYTDFYPLMDLAPPLERGELVRVTVPASAMRRVGMLVMATHLDDPVDADVLIGQDGLARAIRFVTYQ